MRRFDFLNNGLFPSKLVNLTSGIASLKTMAGMRKEEYTQIFTEPKAVAKVQSIKSTDAIEEVVTSDERIAAIVNQNSTPLNHNEAEFCQYFFQRSRCGYVGKRITRNQLRLLSDFIFGLIRTVGLILLGWSIV